METGGGAGLEEATKREREWQDAAEAVAYDSCTWPPPVVAVCGPGNSGKSAFSRLMLNTLIARYKKVGYLDIDVGQPEFTPPGFVSLHVFEENAKDLKIVYLRNPKRCFFFGDVCAKRNPKLLLTYIFCLYDYFLKELYCFGEVDNPSNSAIPLVINTSGWVKGTGLHVLTEMLKYVSPTHVIRVSTTVECKNVPGGIFWINENEGDSSVNLVEIRAAQNPPPSIKVKKEARIIRDLRLIAYFRQCLPSDFPVSCFDDLVQGFVSIRPFKLPLSKIHVIDLHCQCFSNGTIVGMATSASPPLLTECSTPCCIGLGFIKAINVSEDHIHFITPVSQKLMEKVDTLFLSSIALPSCLLQVCDTLTEITDMLREL
ncbi:hypothetical protein BS78_10G129200 [Paspalum vaginatum]|nr:hypothetical protein BS78_10G129200 [Paspalum vaginatum]